ncbi:MAG: hypothetical protein WB424_01815 [Terracidiphilus sp.]
MHAKIVHWITLGLSLSGAVGAPAYAQGWVSSHALIYTIFVGVAIVLHAMLPALFGAPSDAAKQATGFGKVGVILLAVGLSMVATRPGQAQSATPAATAQVAVVFTGGSDVIALYTNHAWGTGNLTTESFDFIDFGKTKSEHLFLEGKELIASQAGFNAYTGGFKIQPDLSKLLKKTNVPPNTFGVYFDASGGAGMIDAGSSHFSLIVGGGIEYRSSSTLSWNPLQVQYVRFGNQNAAVVSTGLNFIFGQR